MALIDFDKFLASFITEIKKYQPITSYNIPACIRKALEDQGLEYNDGEIVKSQRRIYAEAKENGYGESDEFGEYINELSKQFPEVSFAKLSRIAIRVKKWLEKQGGHKPYGQMEECADCQFNYAGECKGSCLMKRGEQKPFNYECANIPQKDFSPAIGIEIPFGAKDSELQETTYLIPEGFHAEIEGDMVVIKKGKQNPVDYDGKAMLYVLNKGVEQGKREILNNLWKPADSDDLPEIDREVIALLSNGKVVYAHRPQEYWDGKNIITNKVTRYEPKRYDKGGWNQPNVKWWLDLDLPKMEE